VEELLIAADIESVDPLLLSDPQPSHAGLQPTASIELFTDVQTKQSESRRDAVPDAPHQAILTAQQPSVQQPIFRRHQEQ
jgi:hypothetical protein